MLKKPLLPAAMSLALFLTLIFSGSLLSSTSYADPQIKGPKVMTVQENPTIPENSTVQETKVLSLIQKMTSNFEQGNLDVVMSTYEKDAAIMFEPGTAVTDPTVAKRIFAEFSALNPKFTYSGHEVIVAGDIAVHLAPWSMLGKTPDGQEITQSGLSVAVLRQQADGSWKMVIDNPHGSRLLAN